MFTLVRDGDGDQDPVFPIVAVLFSVPVPVSVNTPSNRDDASLCYMTFHCVILPKGDNSFKVKEDFGFTG